MKDLYRKMIKNLLLMVTTILIAFNMIAANAVLIGPSGGSGLNGEYNQISDSPFAGTDFSAGYFYLENFEDGLQNTLGVSATAGGVTSVLFGPSIHDSVDGDDGVLDGSGLDGDSWFTSSGGAGVTWIFDASILGMLPTHAGLVWTDGSGDITFEAWDAFGTSLGVLTGNHANSSVNGESEDDRFYGATNLGGISRIRLSNTSAGMELDHLQYGIENLNVSVPEPSSLLMLGLGLAGTLTISRRKNIV